MSSVSQGGTLRAVSRGADALPFVHGPPTRLTECFRRSCDVRSRASTRKRIPVRSRIHKRESTHRMAKLVAIFFALAVAVHMIKPIGLPGLKKRNDAWKLALIGVGAMVVAVVLQPG